MATISEVAAAAGVSTSTVSRYLSGRLRVSPKTEGRIRAAVEELHYVPNASARSLAGGPTGVIGLVIPGLSNPFFAALADSIVDEASRTSMTVLLCPTRDQRSREQQYTDMLEAHAVDGLIYVGAHRQNSHLARVIKGGLPVVVVDEPIAQLPPVTTITVDNFGGGYQATSYLAGLGHRRIAYLGGPEELGTEQERRRGYVQALQSAGIDVDQSLIFSGSYTESFGINALPHLRTLPDAPTAVFCASDYIAMGLISAADRQNVKLPDDLSVVGFDDISVAKLMRPGLTTIRQPVTDLARTAVEELQALITGSRPALESAFLPVELIVRHSAAPLGTPAV